MVLKRSIEQQLSDPTDQLDHQESLAFLKNIRSEASTAPESQHAPGARFKDPILVGLGAFGLIYSAVDLQMDSDLKESNRRVAIKVLRPSKKDNPVAYKRFHSEANALKSISHPNIVQVFDVGQVNAQPLIIIELADQGSLADHLERSNGPIPPRHAAWIMMKIAEALHESHSNRLIHRDIKPGNILLRSATNDERVEGLGLWPLLTDFGLVKETSIEAPRSQWTQEGEVLGTVRYMSPEQVRGEKLKTQTDIFSFGVVLHELLSGVNPFLASSEYETQANIVNHPPRPLDAKLGIPRGLQAIVQRCLNKEPADRYPSANAIAVDLDNLLHGKPISQESTGIWDTIVRLVRRYPIFTAVLLTSLLSILAVVILLNREWRTQQAVNELFLRSINIANSQINDTVIAGARVSHEDLLTNLLQQIPLLEQALSLNPEDRKLAVNLQVMQHYAALCYIVLSEQVSRSDRSELQADGIAMRQKSLDLIERLLKDGPIKDPVAYQRRLKDRIVGEHWMGKAFNLSGQEEQRLHWFNRSIEHAENYLAEYPAEGPIESLLQANRMEKSVALSKQSPSLAIEELEKVYGYYSSRMTNPGLGIESTSYALNALSAMTGIHIQQGETKKIESSMNRCMDFIDGHVIQRTSEDWNYRGLMITTYSEMCRDLVKHRCWVELDRTAKHWRTSIEKLPDWSESGSILEIRKCRESSLLAAIVFEVIAQEHLNQPQDIESSKSRLVEIYKQCKIKPGFRREAFVDSMANYSVLRSDLERLLD
jgi:serine/threonine protein kinase